MKLSIPTTKGCLTVYWKTGEILPADTAENPPGNPLMQKGWGIAETKKEILMNKTERVDRVLDGKRANPRPPMTPWR
jgi:hypothetical protein